MTHQIIPFNFQGSDVRVIDSDGEPWFVAVDVAEALGYSKPFNAVSRHCKAATTTPKQGGGTMTIIPERDVYRLVMRSKMQATPEMRRVRFPFPWLSWAAWAFWPCSCDVSIPIPGPHPCGWRLFSPASL